MFFLVIKLSENSIVITQSHLFILVFTQRAVRLKEWISAVFWKNLIKRLLNIQPSVFNSFLMTRYLENRTGFLQGPLCTFELSKDPPKDKQDFIRFWKASSYVIFSLQKKFLVLETSSLFSLVRSSPPAPPAMCMQSH